ncbi:MAG TPA: TlpA disulfide reductase family protein [Candidatus Limnocylindrales bacterium]|nr:TlpA disulfide reductase family protein [Candidatus Limnocylindrales bacterium]
MGHSIVRRAAVIAAMVAMMLPAGFARAGDPDFAGDGLADFGRADDAGEFGPLILRDLNGTRTSLASLRGKVVVLNFWATWCKPCIEELPLLADLAERYGDRGLVVVAASVDDASSRSDIARVAAALPDSMKVWIGATLEDMERLELGMAVPVTVVLDRKGDVAERQRGSLTRGGIDKTIERLLGGPGDKPKKPFDSVEAANCGQAPSAGCATL